MTRARRRDHDDEEACTVDDQGPGTPPSSEASDVMEDTTAEDPVDDTAVPDDRAGDDGGPDIEAVLVADPRDRRALLVDLTEAERQRDEFLDDLRRSHADFENYRRRVVRDGAVQREQGRVDVTSALLEVLDDLDRTIAVVEGSADEGVAHGIGLVATKLRQVVTRFGLERIDTVGVAFDPTLHEAVQQTGASDEPRVVEVLRPGYRIGERVLRAAMVVVGD